MKYTELHILIDAITSLAIFSYNLAQATNTICERIGYDPSKKTNSGCQVPFYRV